MTIKLRKILLIMSKCALLYLIIVQSIVYSFATSTPVDAQRKKLEEITVQVQLDKANLEEAFSLIEDSTDFVFAYIASDLPKSRISVSSGKQTLKNLLENLSLQSKIAFRRVNETIHVRKVRNKKRAHVNDLVDDVIQFTVRGNVKDENGDALPGVSILEKGTSNGTVTGINGDFALEVQSDDAILVFSFVGYETKEITVKEGDFVDTSLALDVTSLQEIVVVGYGKQEKEDVTGVIQEVGEDEFNKGAIISPDQLISGKIAGVQIISSSGEPGGQTNIRIRGGTSLTASNQPLYVIDGVPIDNSPFNPTGQAAGRNPLSFINPNDIETFTVLKDASAAAIYGSRAANGVIIINTKKGAKGDKNEITYSSWISTAQIVNDVDVLSTQQFREVTAATNETRAGVLGDADTNWRDAVTRTATGFNHAISMTGGTGSMGYRISLSHQDQEGVIRQSESKRTTISLSLNNSFLNDNLDINTNIKASGTRDVFTPTGVIQNSLAMAPTQPILDPGNEFGGYWEWDPADFGVQGTSSNPVAELELTDVQGKTFRSLGNIQFNYKIPLIEGLSAKANLGYDITRGERNRFQPSVLRSQSTGVGGETRVANVNRESELLELYVNYNSALSFLKSRIDVTAGYSYQNFESSFPAYRAFGLSTDIFGNDNPAVASNFQATNSVIENRLISFFGRLNYTIADKYLLTFNIRRDGSSRFSTGNRWGVFPSAAVGWRIMEESFAQGLSKVFTDLKLRFGFGVNGNQEIGDFQYLLTYTPGDSRSAYQFGSSFVPTLRPNAADPTLRWEETTSFNYGLDFGLWNGRINGSIEYYVKETDDLLFTVTVPSGSNLSNRVLTNIGAIRNSGVELQVSGLVVDKVDWSWNIGFNLATNNNEVKRLDGNDDPDFVGIQTGGISGGTGNNIQILRVGESTNAFHVFKHKLENGVPLADGIDHNNDGTIDLADIYEDVNDDGVVNGADRRVFESPLADFTYGFTSNIRYKNADLSFTWRGSEGNYVYNNVKSVSGYLNRVTEGGWPNNMHTDVLKTGFSRPQFFSDYYVEDASFLKLDNITLGYNIPNLNNIQLRVYGTIQNVLVISDYSGQDPEVGTTSSVDPNALGIDNNLYPRSRTFLAGVSLTF